MENISHDTGQMPRSLASPASTLSPADPAPSQVHGQAVNAPAAKDGSPAVPAAPPPDVAPAAALTLEEAASLPLTPPQRTAMIKLTTGSTLIEAATAAGVNRTTLYRWLQNDVNFLAAYNAWQQDLLATGRGRMLAMTREALTTIADGIRGGDMKYAWKLLESQGFTAHQPLGATDAHELQRGQTLERRKKEVALREAEQTTAMRESMANAAVEFDASAQEGGEGR